MIVRFFSTGTSHGESPVHYLLRLRDHNGDIRDEVPELLAGSPQLTIDLINGITRKHKYSSGCLAFRPEEQPTRAQLFNIIDGFKVVVAPGMTEDQFNSLFVIHRDPPDPKTGLVGFHVHFVLPMTLLAGTSATGKDMTGKRWNPHPPGQRTIETMELFTKVINQEMGWAQVMEKPLRVGMDSFWRKADKANHKQKAELLRKELSYAIQSGELKSRAELLVYLDQTLGLTVTRATATSVSVKFPGAAKAMRLKGPMFETHSDYRALCAAQPHSKGTERLSVPQYEQVLERLEHLLSMRAKELQGNAPAKKLHDRTTRKEPVYGRTKERYGGGHASSQGTGRLHSLPLTTSGMERNLFQAGSGQRRNENGRNDTSSHDGPQTLAHPVQHFERTTQGNDGGRQRRSGGTATPSGGDIDQKIWSLAVQLNDCEPGSHEAYSILMQLGLLQGEREQQPKGPRPRR